MNTTPLTVQEIEAITKISQDYAKRGVDEATAVMEVLPRLLSMLTPAPLSPDVEAAVENFEITLKCLPSPEPDRVCVPVKWIPPLLRAVRAPRPDQTTHSADDVREAVEFFEKSMREQPWLRAHYDYLRTILAALNKAQGEVERERMRLAACGTAALGYFDGCVDEYKSASLDDVLTLRAENAAQAEQIKRLREAGSKLLSALSLRGSRLVEFNAALCGFDATLKEASHD